MQIKAEVPGFRFYFSDPSKNDPGGAGGDALIAPAVKRGCEKAPLRKGQISPIAGKMSA